MPDAEALNRKIHDVWLKVPREEQLDLKTVAQSKGLETCSIALIFATSTAIALDMAWFFFGALCLLPLLYQVATTKFWRALKIKTNLQYLVASTTARRYAKAGKASDLTLKMIFKGSIRPCTPAAPPGASEEEDSESSQHPAVDVWVSLFPRYLVIISESDKGAKLILGHSIVTDFRAFTETEEKTDSHLKQLFLEIEAARGTTVRWSLSTHHPTTLLAFEKKISLFTAQEQQREAPLEERLHTRGRTLLEGHLEQPVLSIESPNSESRSTFMPRSESTQ